MGWPLNEHVDQWLVIRAERNFYSIGIKVGDLTIYNVYKPPSYYWNDIVLPKDQHPGKFKRDFNSHSTEWGYSDEDDNGEKLSNWGFLNFFLIMMPNKEVHLNRVGGEVLLHQTYAL